MSKDAQKGPVQVVRGRLALASQRQGEPRRTDLAGLASALAAPHMHAIDDDALHRACEVGLEAGGLPNLDALATHPEGASACAQALTRVWNAGKAITDIPSDERTPRLDALAALEQRVREILGPRAGTPLEVLRRAERALREDEATIPQEVTFVGRAGARRGARLLANTLARRTKVRWVGPSALMPHWAQSPHIEVRTEDWDDQRTLTRVSAAHPLHEVLTARGWARAQLEAGAEPGDIAIALTSPADHETHAAARSAGITLCHTRGIPALETPEGQACAALAAHLERGDRETLARCEAALTREALAETGALEANPTPALARTLAARPEAPEGTSALWETACAQAKRTSTSEARALARLRVKDPNEACDHTALGPLADIADAGRSHVLVAGLSASRWPPSGRAEESVLGAREARSLGLGSEARGAEAALEALRAQTRTTLVLSRPRRDGDGRSAAPAVLPAWANGQREHALARGGSEDEPWPSIERAKAGAGFTAPAHGEAAARAYAASLDAGLGPHDGRTRRDHPVIAHIARRTQSPSSLARMITDPLGFIWRYGLMLSEPETIEDPSLGLDARARGNLVHALAAAATAALEGAPGDAGRATHAVQSACATVPDETPWCDVAKTMGPALWGATLAAAARQVRWALAESPHGAGATRSKSEMRFSALRLTGCGMRIEGYIDRVDLAQDGTPAGVVDYKSGRARARGAVLDGGRELQRCLYAAAARGSADPDDAGAWPESWLVYLRDERASKLEDVPAALAAIDAAAGAARDALLAGDAVPGPGTGAPYDPLRFLLPANAAHDGLARKEEAARALAGEALTAMWEMR